MTTSVSALIISCTWLARPRAARAARPSATLRAPRSPPLSPCPPARLSAGARRREAVAAQCEARPRPTCARRCPLLRTAPSRPRLDGRRPCAPRLRQASGTGEGARQGGMDNHDEVIRQRLAHQAASRPREHAVSTASLCSGAWWRGGVPSRTRMAASAGDFLGSSATACLRASAALPYSAAAPAASPRSSRMAASASTQVVVVR